MSHTQGISSLRPILRRGTIAFSYQLSAFSQTIADGSDLKVGQFLLWLIAES
jgi:hypothetical protein